MPLLLFFFFFLHTPVRFSEGSQSGTNSLYSGCAGLPLVKGREHIRALRSDAESLRPIAARKPFQWRSEGGGGGGGGGAIAPGRRPKGGAKMPRCLL